MNDEKKFIEEKSAELGNIITNIVNEYLSKVELEIEEKSSGIIFNIIENSISGAYFSYILAFCKQEGLSFSNAIIAEIKNNFTMRINTIKNIILKDIH